MKTNNAAAADSVLNSAVDTLAAFTRAYPAAEAGARFVKAMEQRFGAPGRELAALACARVALDFGADASSVATMLAAV